MFAIGSAFVLAAHIALVAQPPPVVGYWEGAIHLPAGANLAIQITLSQQDDEGLSGCISIPVQGLRDGRLNVAFDPPAITFSMTGGIPGNPAFKGNMDGDVISGDFTQGGHTFAFDLKRIGDTKLVVKAALPKGLTERDVTVGTSPWELPGTLTLPQGNGPFAAAILVHGSGPNDRDERIGDSFTFRDVAWGLAQKGIAVLRYDKRTFAHGAKFAELKNFTLNDETVDDAVLAVKLANQIQEINPKKVFVIGHSLGAYALGRIAEKAPSAAGFVSMAGPARPVEDLVQEQLSTRGGLSEDGLKKLNESVVKVKSKDLTTDTPAGELPFGIAASFWLDLRGYDPVDALKRSKRPALILQGEADVQVTMTDFAMWKKGFPKAECKSFPKLNHLFMPVEGKSTGDEYAAPGQSVNAGVIETMAAWIKAN